MGAGIVDCMTGFAADAVRREDHIGEGVSVFHDEGFGSVVVIIEKEGFHVGESGYMPQYDAAADAEVDMMTANEL